MPQLKSAHVMLAKWQCRSRWRFWRGAGLFVTVAACVGGAHAEPTALTAKEQPAVSAVARHAALISVSTAPGLDRVAYAVEGAESDHGQNPAMWRSDPDGPQGPMQVSHAAALAVGDGDRFDAASNRALGRAFLGLMYQRYGNWPDALAAYNWGPARVDAWIGAGRDRRVPAEVIGYIRRVLQNSNQVHAGPAWLYAPAAGNDGASSWSGRRNPTFGPYTDAASASHYGWANAARYSLPADEAASLSARSLGVSMLAYDGWRSGQGGAAPDSKMKPRVLGYTLP